MIDLIRTEIGAASILRSNDHYELKTFGTASDQQGYSDAQLTTYSSRDDINLHPPIRMQLQARFTGDIQGTAGFGFWNQPFIPGQRGIYPPKALWFFFGSSQNNMALAKGVSGSGWKAATIDATRWQFWALLPTAPVGFLLMRIPQIYQCLWPIGQAALGISERELSPSLMLDWTSYAIEWKSDEVIFYVDDEVIFRSLYSPRGNLGFIAWIDNQYAIVTPQGKFGSGVIRAVNEQTLFLCDMKLVKL